jgi:hypothetical protein
MADYEVEKEDMFVSGMYIQIPFSTRPPWSLLFCMINNIYNLCCQILAFFLKFGICFECQYILLDDL